MDKRVRVRFAPSPTGGLHLGGMRTVLYNYLFAKKLGGDIILRIEDTDQSRYVAGAEEYIFNCLKWAGLEPNESSLHGGSYGPYRQSERKDLYRKYAEQLVKDDLAYYAFDTPEDLEKMRHDFKTEQNPSPQYDHNIRMKMRNSLSLNPDETKKLLDEGTRHVFRIKMPEHETITFNDMIRGEVSFDTSLVDDKVLLKADGMPTYHLAVVVDDHLMKISHAFRGEEWLSSAPVHILLWKYLFGLKEMPQWAHLPLILGPNGKLSKRDGAKYGFPVFTMSWTDPKTGEFTKGFKEEGFSPSAFINFLALLGWNDGTEQEIFTKRELIEKFSMDRVHKAGAKFDYEKAKWFLHEWRKRETVPSEQNVPLDWFQPINQPIQQKKQTSSIHGKFYFETPKPESDILDLMFNVLELFHEKGIEIIDRALFTKVFALVKDRCTLLTDFYDQSYFFFKSIEKYDLDSVKPKWNDSKRLFFAEVVRNYELNTDWTAAVLEKDFKEIAAVNQIKPGEVLLPLRIMLVGGKFGPGVFDIAEVLGKEETLTRIKKALPAFS